MRHKEKHDIIGMNSLLRMFISIKAIICLRVRCVHCHNNERQSYRHDHLIFPGVSGVYAPSTQFQYCMRLNSCTAPNCSMELHRLDSQHGWLPRPQNMQAGQLEDFSHWACRADFTDSKGVKTGPPHLDGKWALVANSSRSSSSSSSKGSSHECTYETIIGNVQVRDFTCCAVHLSF